MSTSEIIQIVCAIVSLLITIAFFVAEKRQNNRIEKRDIEHYNESIESAARSFIQKYSESQGQYDKDIFLLPLCSIAALYNPLFPYKRKIYSEYCHLSQDVQKRIFELEKITQHISFNDGFFDKIVLKVKSIISLNYPGDQDVFYDSAKYLEGALLSHGNQEIPSVVCEIDEHDATNEFSIRKEQTMNYVAHVTNLLAYEKLQQPIGRLWNEQTNIGIPSMDDELLTTYLCCLIAKYSTMFSDTEEHKSVLFDERAEAYLHDYSGVKYMEDLFLEVLLVVAIYCSEYDEGVEASYNCDVKS